MGYFNSAFILQGEPDGSRLAGVARSLAMLAMRHEASGLCLLHVRDRAEDEPRWPFSHDWRTPLAAGLQDELATLDPVQARRIEAFCAAAEVASDEVWSIDALLRPSLQVGALLQRALGVPLFFFAANDDGLNLAWSMASDGSMSAARVEGECGHATWSGDAIEVHPVFVVYEDDDDDLDIDLDPLDRFEGEVRVHESRRVPQEEDEGRELCSACVATWPQGWPDPTDSLGLGTWDPLDGYPKGYATSFSRE